MFYDEKQPFMPADVDRMVVGENTGLECKTASPFMTDKWEDGYGKTAYGAGILEAKQQPETVDKGSVNLKTAKC